MDFYFSIVKRIFLILSIILGFFSGLMLYHFISLSIKDEQKTIGILKALGTSKSDIFFLYFAKNIVIVSIIYLFSLITTFVVGYCFNVLLSNYFRLQIFMLTPGIRQILMLLLFSAVICFAATFLPTHKISKMKPIDAIKKWSFVIQQNYSVSLNVCFCYGWFKKFHYYV